MIIQQRFSYSITGIHSQIVPDTVPQTVPKKFLLELCLI
jgi:hypothetical protein